MQCAVTGCQNLATLTGRWMLMRPGRTLARQGGGFHMELPGAGRVCDDHADAARRQRMVIEAHARHVFPIDDFVDAS